MSMYSLALSDAGKTKIAVRFDENDGILKYYKEFGSMSCHVKGPPSSSIKVMLLDNSMKQICPATDSGVLAVPNHESIRTDLRGDATFSCIVNKGCQAYDSIFFVIAVTWDCTDDNTILSTPFVSGSKGPAEPMNDKNRFRPSYICYTSLSSFKDDFFFNCENKWQRDSTRVTLVLHEGKELRMYSGTPSTSRMQGTPEAFYYKAKTRSQSHKLEVVEKLDAVDLDQKIKERLSSTTQYLVQLLVKSVQRQQLSESECRAMASDIPNQFNELFQTEYFNQNQNASVSSDLMSPSRRTSTTKSKGAPSVAITPLAKSTNLVSFRVKDEPVGKAGSSSSTSSGGAASASGNKRNRTHFLDTDEWQSTVNEAPSKGRSSFPRPKHSSNSGSSGSSSSSAAKDTTVKNEPIDFDDPRSPFYYPGSRSTTITGIAGSSSSAAAAGDDEEQFMNSQNSLLTTGNGGMFSRTGSINPHAFDDDTGDGIFDGTASAAGTASGGASRAYSLRGRSLQKGIASSLTKGFSVDSSLLDELAASGQNFDSMISKDGGGEGLTDSQEAQLLALTRTNTVLVEEDMLFDAEDLLSRSNTLNKEGGAAAAGGVVGDVSAAVTAAANAILEENRNKGINILISAIDKKAAHTARELVIANETTTTAATGSSVTGNRDASVSVNNSQDTSNLGVENVVPSGGAPPTITSVLHDSFVGDWMLTQSQ